MDSPATAMFRMVIAEGRNLIRQRGAIEKQAHAALGGNADYQRLRQIPGIGPIHAMTIMAEAGDLRRFRHHRQFLKFCGLDLATHQSGQFRGLTKLSKFGNARLRCALWMAAQVAIRQRDNSFRAKLERLYRQGSRQCRPQAQGTNSRYRQDGAHSLCHHQVWYRLSALH
jgi:transposase